MKVEELSLGAIKPYEKNPRKNEGAVDGVAESIKRFGFQQPIVIDANGVIIVGHTRYKAAKKLRLATVPCVRAEDLTEAQVKAYRILDNKLNELAVWDFEKLGKELAQINDDFNDFNVVFPPFEYNTFTVEPNSVPAGSVENPLETENTEYRTGDPAQKDYDYDYEKLKSDFSDTGNHNVRLMIHFENDEAIADFVERTGLKINRNTKFCYFEGKK